MVLVQEAVVVPRGRRDRLFTEQVADVEIVRGGVVEAAVAIVDRDAMIALGRGPIVFVADLGGG